VWRHLRKVSVTTANDSGAHDEAGRVLLEEGCLSRRILNALDGAADRDSLARVYRRLCECLAEGTMFHA